MQDPPEADPEAHHRYITLSDWEGQGERSPSRRYARLYRSAGTPSEPRGTARSVRPRTWPRCGVSAIQQAARYSPRRSGPRRRVLRGQGLLARSWQRLPYAPVGRPDPYQAGELVVCERVRLGSGAGHGPVPLTGARPSRITVHGRPAEVIACPIPSASSVPRAVACA